jgi:hypothetical protein
MQYLFKVDQLVAVYNNQQHVRTLDIDDKEMERIQQFEHIKYDATNTSLHNYVTSTNNFPITFTRALNLTVEQEQYNEQ